ncbi:RNA polymerase sporulation sigma factor SigH [Egicoccus sp. AB-alg2]|uniref:RNA polymerase sporulation sigma factor SigH n=1 Tax=Egicoccus sp. AB-alg2 TaxID=3242693 RepID=UPI00359E3049
MTQRTGLATSARRAPAVRRRRRSGARHHALTDEALVDRARGGDETATTELLLRYRPLAQARARNYFLVGGDQDDLAQEAMLGLFKAVRDFSPRSGASFRSFAELCITRQVLTAVRGATRHKHRPLNTSVSLDRPHDSRPDVTIGEVLPATDAPDPLAVVVADDDLGRLRAALDASLSGLEAQVLGLYVEGRTYEEIADRLGRHVKAVDNALQRVKRKLEDRPAA